MKSRTMISKLRALLARALRAAGLKTAGLKTDQAERDRREQAILNEMLNPSRGTESDHVDAGEKLRNRVARNIDWYLDAYPGLDPDEQQAVEEFIELHPEHPKHSVYQTRMLEARMMSELLYDAGALADAGRDEETLPYALVAEYVPGFRMPECLSTALSRLTRRRQGEAGLSSAYLGYRSRMSDQPLHRTALEHFEYVTGHVVAESVQEPSLDSGSRRHPGPRFQRAGTAPTPTDRPPAAGRVRKVMPSAKAMAGPLALVASVIIVLYGANYLNESPTERMAHIRTTDLNWAYVGKTNRGFLTSWEKEAFRGYSRAIDLVAESRKSIFGLFPTYRSYYLYRARRILKVAMDEHRKSQTPSPEAFLLLGKLNFLLGDMDKAIPALRDASFQDGRAAAEAHTFLYLFGPQNGK